MNTVTKASKVGLGENMTYRVFDKNGKARKLWQNNRLGEAILRYARSVVKDPIAKVVDRKGNVVSSYVKSGILNKIAAHGIQLPFITGMSTYQLRGANLVTNAGLAGIASRINGAGSEAAFTYIAIGTGTTAADATDTTLETEITTGGGERASATVSRTTTTVTNDTARHVLTYNFTSTFAVTEAGVLNAASTGTLLNRQVFTAVNVANGDSLQVTIDLDVS